MSGSVLSVSAGTRVLAVIGHPVSHSLSPLIHNAALTHQGIDAVYLAFDVRPEDLVSAFAGIRALGLLGANITVPHKERALDLVDEVDPAAAAVGAMNTVVNSDGVLRGYNTDIVGFTQALGTVRPAGASGCRCLVLGAGGAARAVVAALLSEGAAEVLVHNRTGQRAERLCEAAEGWGKGRCRAIAADRIAVEAPSVDIIVNASSVGLGDTVKESPIPVDILDSHHVVVDLVYGPTQTRLVREAVARGANAIDGREMLVAQAAVSYCLWTGVEAPIDVMRAGVGQVGR